MDRPLKTKVLAACLAATLAGPLPAHDDDTHEPATPAPCHDHSGHAAPTSHAPLGVMGDHLHHRGGWMVSYRHMAMDMDGNRDGTRRLSDRQVLSRFMITPRDMDMRMDMLGVMYAPSDELTWMLMIPRIQLSMEHQNRLNRFFTTESEGLGDISLSALLKDEQREGFRSHFQLGLRAPTGEVDVYDATPLGPNSLLPYPMRLGGGTYAAILGYTQVRDVKRGVAGLQVRATMPFGRNDEGYRLGDELLVTGWRQWELGANTAVSARLAWNHWADLHGADPRLNPGMIPTANPDLRGGDRLDFGVGGELGAARGPPAGARVPGADRAEPGRAAAGGGPDLDRGLPGRVLRRAPKAPRNRPPGRPRAPEGPHSAGWSSSQMPTPAWPVPST